MHHVTSNAEDKAERTGVLERKCRRLKAFLRSVLLLPPSNCFAEFRVGQAGMIPVITIKKGLRANQGGIAGYSRPYFRDESLFF
ncbi:hypothetical protein SDC9_37310 [bioreactor metagenome]|uniref:Uncharacterized protein n=1 Tax=bioreactor metagenome TaxID=1076179 RepID=A0A644VIN1_9ZZZZ